MTTLFVRKQDGKSKRFLATPEVEPDCQWVIDGEGVAHRKWDGTCCAIIKGVFYKRRVVKGKFIPKGWRHWSGRLEQLSGHGWMPVGDDNDDQWHRAGFRTSTEAWCSGFIPAELPEDGREPADRLPDGTYELVGPKIQGGAEGIPGLDPDFAHFLMKHDGHDGVGFATQPPRDFDGLRAWMVETPVEGVVWHHPDGRMAKLKRRDFDIPWPLPRPQTP